jgi:hypothetical protein
MYSARLLGAEIGVRKEYQLVSVRLGDAIPGDA